jgi:hypothetical protein
MSLWTYSPEDVVITIGGFYSIEGIPEGTFVDVKKDLMPFTAVRSTDGAVARTKVINTTYTIELSIMQSSPSNDMLTRLWQLDELTSQGKFPLLIKDTRGTGYFFSTETWIEGVPTLNFSSIRESQVWTLRSDMGYLHIGGNSENTAIEDVADLALSGLPYVQQVLQGAGFQTRRTGTVDITEG